MHIYIIKTNTFTKIGITSNFINRMKAYAVNNPNFGEWEILAIPCEKNKAEKIEYEIKYRYRHLTNKTSTEWLDVESDEIIRQVKEKIKKYNVIEIKETKNNYTSKITNSQTIIQTLKILIYLYNRPKELYAYAYKNNLEDKEIIILRRELFNVFYDINNIETMSRSINYNVSKDLNKIFNFYTQNNKWSYQWRFKNGQAYFKLPNIENGRKTIKAYINKNQDIKTIIQKQF